MPLNLSKYRAKVQAIIDLSLSPLEQQFRLSQLPAYIGRGHGGRYKAKGRFLGNLHTIKSKYAPHQGKRECARRLSRRVSTLGLT